MKKSIVEIVSDYLGYTFEQTIEISKHAPKTYRHYRIPKKKGGFRIIYHPSKLTKSLQYALISTVLKHLPIHKAAKAYRRGVKSPLLMNAKIHSKLPYSVRIDFKDFFPSIVPEDLFNSMQGINKFNNLTREEKEFLKNSLFIKGIKGRILAIGAPSSPIVSNIVMYKLDEEIQLLANTISTNSAYSRYADDIVFSSHNKGDCNNFYDQIKLKLQEVSSPKLSINEVKTIFTSRGSRRVITGLFICPNGNISIGRKNKKYIKKLLFDFKNNNLNNSNLKYLRGYVSYILDVEPYYYHRLAIKYSADLLENIRRNI